MYMLFWPSVSQRGWKSLGRNFLITSCPVACTDVRACIKMKGVTLWQQYSVRLKRFLPLQLIILIQTVLFWERPSSFLCSVLYEYSTLIFYICLLCLNKDKQQQQTTVLKFNSLMKENVFFSNMTSLSLIETYRFSAFRELCSTRGIFESTLRLMV